VRLERQKRRWEGMRDEENEGWLEQEKDISDEGKGGWQSVLILCA
jgi:hypothetical protein